MTLQISILFRLVSAYEDKVLCSQCTSKQRSKTYKNLEEKTFPEFVDHILMEYKKSDCNKSYNFPCPSIDVHWRPYNARCAYCDIPYNVIGRLETFDDDIKYILLKQNLTSLLPLDASQLHVHNTVG